MFRKSDDYNFNFSYESPDDPHAVFDNIISSWDVIKYFKLSILQQVKELFCKEFKINGVDELSDNERKIFEQTLDIAISCLLDYISDYDCPINIYNPREILKIDDDFKDYLIDLYEYSE